MKHYSVHFDPDNLTAFIHEGATLLEAAQQVGIILTTPCGGVGRCGKCRVHLLPSSKEVLACQCRIHHNLEVRIPNSSRYFRQQILQHGIQHQAALEPSVRKIFLEGPFSGFDEFCSSLSHCLKEPFIIQDNQNDIFASMDWGKVAEVTAVLLAGQTEALPPETSSWTLNAIENGNTELYLYGIAIDIGTTTVVARLLDLTTGETKATASCGNPQVKYGADVISRITHGEQIDGLQQLNECIIACLNELIEEVSQSAFVDKNWIYEVVVAGNTTMNHLLLKYPVKQLGQAPYRAYSVLSANRRPDQLGIQINVTGNIHTIANIAGFVGSDTVAAALACQLDAADEGILLVDIGTNGEIVLSANNQMVAASCAAGPALEGAGITFGSRAQIGAIERVIYNGSQVDVDVIGGVTPSSICGSGLIDAAAVMLNAGVIDETGRFLEPDEISPDTPKGILKRIIKVKNEPAFLLSGHPRGDDLQGTVCLTQRDVRQLQLAKAAIHAGIELLLRNAGITASNVKKLLLAGAFGNYIRKEDAVRIGLLPHVPLERIHFVGNAAQTGAEMILVSRKARRRAEELAREVKYLEIAHQAEFQTLFSDSMLFPLK